MSHCVTVCHRGRDTEKQGGNEPTASQAALPSPSGPDWLERKARELLEEAKGTPGVTITDEAKALAYYRSVARLAARGEDEEREALQTEERGRVVDLAAHRRTIEGLLRTASPVASLPGAVMNDGDLVPLIRALLKASPGRAWTGTVADLLAALRLDTREPRALGKRLHRILPHLAAAGIEMSFSRRGKKRTRVITIRPAADISAPPSPLATLLLAAPPAWGRLMPPAQLAACREQAALQQRALHRENALLEARLRRKRHGLTLQHIHRLIEALAAASPHDRPLAVRSIATWLEQQGLSAFEIATILFAATEEPPPMSHLDKRLRALLAARNVTSPVLQSVASAGRQLELLTPIVLARTPQGITIEPRVVVPRGTILIVVADQSRAAVAPLNPSAPARQSLPAIARQSLPAIARHVLDLVPQTELRDAIAVILDTLLTDGSRASEGEAFNLVSALLATLPETDLVSLGEGIEQTIDHDICPALIALRGPASDGNPNHVSIAWPLLMPVARYLEK